MDAINFSMCVKVMDTFYDFMAAEQLKITFETSVAGV